MLPRTVFTFNYQDLTSRTSMSPYNDFSLIHKNKIFKFNSFIAATLSRTIAELFFEDPYTDKFILDIEDGPSEQIAKFLQGENVFLKGEDSLFIFKASVILKIPILIENTLSIILKTLDYKELFNLGKFAFENGVECNDLVEEFAPHTNDLFKEGKLAGLDPSFLDIILRFPSAKLECRDLLSLLTSYFNFASNPNHRLVFHFPFSKIDTKLAESFILKPQFNINRLRFRVPHIGCKQLELGYNANSGQANNSNTFQNLIRDAFRPKVTFSSSNSKFRPEIIFYEYGYFETKPEQIPYFILDFEDNSVMLTGYSITTEGNLYPVHWVIEGSTDGQAFVKIDERESHISGFAHFELDNCQTYYNRYKFKQIRSSLAKFNALRIAQIDLSGSIRYLTKIDVNRK